MSSNRKRPTLKDVAKEAGLSVGMVSRVLSGYGYYSESSKIKVKQAASKLDYRPNAIARSLRRGYTKAIGVLTSNIASYHWTNFVRGVEEAAMKHGFHVILSNTNDDEALERAYLKALYERNVDGIIVSPLLGNQDDLQKLSESGFPMVLIDSGIATMQASRINLDNAQGAYEATTYLISQGHKRIALVAGSLEIASGIDRRQGYLDALRDAGIKTDESLIGYGNYQYQQAYEATVNLLAQSPLPTALLICGETMTGASLQCLKDHNIAIPEAMSVVAFDDPAWASFYRPALTAVHTPRYDVGALAFETLLALIRQGGEERDFQSHMIQTSLIVRESCRHLKVKSG